MYKKVISFSLVFFLFLPLVFTDAGSEGITCTKTMKITDVKFSVKGSANGEVSVNDIGSAVVQRNAFCAMEMVEFDNTAEAHDYFTEEAVTLRDSFFVVDSGVKTPLDYGILAFKDKESAEKFISEKGRGKVVTFDELVNLKF